MNDALTTQEQRFVDAFAGDLEAAALSLGLEVPAARRLLAKPAVADAIRARELAESGKARGVATRLERQQFWSRLMTDEANEKDLRIKASELLGRSEGDFIERRILEGPGGGPMLGLQLQVTATDLADRVIDIRQRQVLPPAQAPAALMECLL